MIELRLGWRNVWRNPRSAGLTVAAIAVGVVLVVLSVALAAGFRETLVEDSVRHASGHLSISGEGYLQYRSLEQFVHFDSALEQRVQEVEAVRGYAPRLSSFALLSKRDSTSVVALLGVDPQRESSVSVLSDRVRRGSFVSSGGPPEIVLGERLAGKLSADIGDSLLMYSTAYTLESAYGLFDVVGVMKLPDPRLDGVMAVISLSVAQEFFVYGDRVSEVAILTDTADSALAVADALRGTVGEIGEARVHTWDQLMPEIHEALELADAGTYMMVAILVIIVGFGILNTFLMTVIDRRKEFGIVVALGLKPRVLFRIIYVEALLYAGLGVLVGLTMVLPLVLFLESNPIWMSDAAGGLLMEEYGYGRVVSFKLEPFSLTVSILTLVGQTLLAALYPAITASRVRPVESLRSI